MTCATCKHSTPIDYKGVPIESYTCRFQESYRSFYACNINRWEAK